MRQMTFLPPYCRLCDRLSRDQSKFVGDTMRRGKWETGPTVIESFRKRWLDIPPVWLLLAMAVVWFQVQILPLGAGFGRWISPVVIWVIWGAAAVLTAAALQKMRKHRTTVHPHDAASHLVTTGVFRRTRNPIYVSDVLVLSGFVIWFGTWASIGIVGLFIWVLQHRFIRPEELRLKSQFPTEWAEYKNTTRRWI